jgi:uncharacterized protein (DUF697 family)
MSDREQRALNTVKNYVWWSMGAGLIPVPFMDLRAVSGAQLGMVSDLARIYGVEFQANRDKTVVEALTEYVLPGTRAGTLIGAPTIVLFCGALAWALGQVFIEHFEAGGTPLTFDPGRAKKRFEQQFAEGTQRAAEMETSAVEATAA